MIMVGVRRREETRPDTIPVVVVSILSACNPRLVHTGYVGLYVISFH